MTDKEKARAYDEVREKIALRFGSNVAEEIFSEFEMSEDEKIRKALISRFDESGELDGISYDNIRIWLEKQGTSYTKRDVDDAYVEGMTFAKNELEKQKSAEWSEEDEKMYNIVFEEYKNRQYYSHPNLKSRDICGEILGWLKSLKQRCTWKPSKAQMKALDSVIDEYDGYPEFDSLVSLKNDLKKL